MNRNTLESTFAKLFGSRSDAALKAIVEGPIVREALAKAESEEVKRRTALVKQLADLPKVHEKRCEDLNEAVSKARTALDAAHAAVSAATARHSETYTLAMSASMVYASEQSRLELELQRSADPRIDEFERRCDQLRCNDARHAPMTSVLHKDERSGTERLYFDASHGATACEALNAAVLQCRALRLKALTSSEITAALLAIRETLVKPLAVINLKAPTVESDDLTASAAVH
jgi:hypothetical protein